MIFNQLVDDIRDEPCLWSLKSPPKPEDQDRAWRRVASKNKLSSLEVKLIFRELSKKYKEERKKPNSTWKLLESLKFLDEDTEREGKSVKPPTLRAAPPQALPQTFPDDTKVKEEPITTAQNTSDDDYVELLEVRDDDFSDDDMEIDNDTRMKVKNANLQQAQPELGQQIKPGTQNKSISIRKPSVINNIKPQTDSVSSVAISSTKATTPMIFSNLKRKLAGEYHANGSASTIGAQEPPEKQAKSNLDKSNKQTDVAATTAAPRISTPTANTPPPQPGFDSIETSPASPIIGRISPPKPANFSSDSNSGPIAILGLEANSGAINIGDVIPMSKIKTEKSDDVVLENIPIQMCGNLNSVTAKPLVPVEDDQPTTNQHKYSTPHSRRHDSFGQYVTNTLISLPEGLANKLEVKILEAIIAIHTEKNNLV